MNNSNEDTDNEDQQKEERKIKKIKEEYLDEAFKKAELLKKAHLEIKKEQRIVKKPFIKIGIIIFIIAILGFVLVNYIPWMYIKYDSDYGTIEEYFSYIDFKDNDIKLDEIRYFFESTCKNCSNNSNNYIGLTINDISGTERTISNSLLALALLGFIFTVFIIIDRVKNFSEDTVNIIHSIFIVSIIIISLIVFLLTIKYLSAHLLMEINSPFVEVFGATNINVFFFIPYIFFLASLCLLIFGLILIKSNFNKAVQNLEVDKSQKSSAIYRYGSNL